MNGIKPGPVTKTIAAINLILAMAMAVPSLQQAMLVGGGFIPGRFGSSAHEFASVAYVLPFWLTPISSAFLHGGLMHVAFNMLMLILVGPNLERILGAWPVAFLYIVGLLFAALAEYLAHPTSMVPVVGASGAISALVAAHASLFPQYPPKPLGPLPGRPAHALKLLGGWVLINALFGFVGPYIGMPIAIYAHIGGFIAGLLLVWPLLSWRYRKA